MAPVLNECKLKNKSKVCASQKVVCIKERNKHKTGLMHSGTPGQEYGDCSCAMSNCGGKRCFNVAQSWNLVRDGFHQSKKLPLQAYNLVSRFPLSTSLGSPSSLCHLMQARCVPYRQNEQNSRETVLRYLVPENGVPWTYKSNPMLEGPRGGAPTRCVWEKHFLPAVQVEPSSTYDRNFLRITLTDLEEPGAVFVSYRYERHQAALHMCSKFLRILSTIKINMWQKLRSRLALSPCYSEVGANIALLEMSCLLLISKKKHEAAGISRQTKIEPTLRERLSTNQQWDSSDLLGSDEMAGLVVSFDGIRGSFAAVRGTALLAMRSLKHSLEFCPAIQICGHTSPVRDKSPSCLDGNSRGTKSQEGNDGAQIKDASNLRWA
eukprot:1143481-Pelagomonas_calceolata.AAC.8